MDKNFNEFFEELNDMANFKNFGESKEEEIMIDGVNVEGCGFYHPEIDNYCHIALAFAEDYTDDNHTYLECEQNPNCYYKQLKRLEQENAELKAENERLKEINISLNESLGNLKIMQNTIENKLRDTENRLISIQKSNTHNLVLLQRCKFCLQEIKAIATRAFTVCDDDCGNANKFTEILDLITKAESEG